ILVVFVSVNGQESQPVIPAYFTPDVIFVNTVTRIEVNAVMPRDERLLRQSVNVVRLYDDGRATIAAQLYDDGTHGDFLGGDNIYSGQLDLNEPRAADIKFVITAGYRGELKRITSLSFVVTVTARPTREELQHTVQTEQNAGRRFATLRNQVGDQRARESVI